MPTDTEPLAPAVLAEDLRALAESVPFEAQTRDVLAQAAAVLDAVPDRPVELTDARILDVLADAWHADCLAHIAPAHPHPARAHAPALAALLPAIRQLLAEVMPSA